MEMKRFRYLLRTEDHEEKTITYTEIPADTILLTEQQLDEWVRIHLWQNMGIEPSAKDYGTLVLTLKELFK